MVPLTGVVLAGGASRRLGRDKALLVAGGQTLAARAAAKLAAVCPEVAAADAARNLLPGIPSLPDGPGHGPAAGILGAARARPGHRLLVLACDLPEVPIALLTELVKAAGEKTSGREEARPPDLVVPRWAGRLEPLCALYGPAALEALASRVAAGHFALHELADEPELVVRFIEEPELASFGDPAELFLNLNSPADLARWA
jgi:molybdopterin-guanine dinucleotide biosynthesis protein A